MQRDTGLTQAVTAVLEALFHRDADADELGPGLLHDVAQAAHGLTARHEVIDDEDLVRGTEPLLGDKQRDLLLIGIGKNVALIEAALDVVALGLLGEHHRHAEGLRADCGQGDAAGFGRQHKGDVLAGKHAPEFLRDLLHQWLPGRPDQQQVPRGRARSQRGHGQEGRQKGEGRRREAEAGRGRGWQTIQRAGAHAGGTPRTRREDP